MSHVSESVELPTETKLTYHWWFLIVGVILIMTVVHVFPLFKVKEPEMAENRVLASLPPFPKSVPEWAALPAKLDAFVIDQFPLRTQMITRLNFVRYTVGYSGSKRIIVGQNGWLFYDDGSHLSLMSGSLILDKPSVDAWVSGFRQRVDYLKKRDTKFYFMVAPVKEDIYPENRPKWMPEVRVTTEIDEIINASRKAGFDQIIDPREAIFLERQNQKLYDEFDTHWTGLGAYIAYQQLMTRMSKDFADLQPLPMAAFTPVPVTKAGTPRDLSLMLGISDFVPHDRVSFAGMQTHPPEKTTFLSDNHSWVAPQVLHTEAKTGKTLLLLRDSFSTELLPLLKKHFDTIVMAHVQDGFFRTDLIEQFNPDAVAIVVIETGTRHSMGMIPSLSEP
ncbi:hypothetical protein GIW41_07925 [Pseudomonas sp. PA-6-1D]|uniref:AlgX/AlgJ SGNH hydrolase-like domain-containing protein n=2 Tax=Pseudomonas edaphica TaxID=2006980 RepID=A0A7Y8JJL5_9PSED|nr:MULTISPECIES: hypothetical protein [Pseudomonas]MCF5140741.1 hypothetical protein [Pseudomonas sp. PA-6-3C]MCF5145922.1 hypothetical protein [Pseudomonas sp. PA-6-3F]MCF5161897.1 hypothetical protein [Pseudomonas sp. PA-6-2E]MCF5175171.1 hypothetical protein [Pseudomonas sp. PA-6-1D]MCF5191455.1 hypothetical protein [Pseudomonas sp. PA-6-1H]